MNAAVTPRARDGNRVPRRGAAILWDHPGWWQVLLLAQAVLLAVGIRHQFATFMLSHDFAAYWQAVWWIGAHHRFFPPDSVFGWPALANNAEVVLLPIGLLGYPLWPHPSLLLVVQDGALLGAEAMAWRWIAALTRDVPPRVRFGWLGAAMISLTANPWMLRTALFDFHPEAILALALVAAARAITERRVRAAVAWSLLAVSCGTLGALSLIGLAGSAAWQRQGRMAAVLAIAGLAALETVSALHWNRGSVLAGSYHYLFAPRHPVHVSAWNVLTAVLTHPGRALAAIAGHGPSLFFNWLPTGFIGWASPLVAGPVAVLSAVNNLVQPHLGTHFGAPGFQNAPLYPLLTVGAFDRLRRWTASARRGWRWAAAHIWVPWIGATCLGAFFSLFALMWIPATLPANATLAAWWRRIPPSHEVIASQQIVGRFGDRPWVYGVMQRQHFPLHTSVTDVLLYPGFGGRLIPVSDQRQEVRDLLRSPSARLVRRAQGVWWFAVRRTPGGLALPYSHPLAHSTYGLHQR